MEDKNIIDIAISQQADIKKCAALAQELIELADKLNKEKAELVETNKTLFDFCLQLVYKLYHSDLTPTEISILKAYEKEKSLSKIGKDAFASKTTVFNTLEKLKESAKYGEYSTDELKELLKKRGIF